MGEKQGGTTLDLVRATFHIENFGCRAARADGEAIAERLRAADCVEQESDAEVVIVNTCSVTAEADREARAFIRRTHRLNPGAKIVATGCYAQRAPEELAGLDGVAAVVGNSHKALVPEIALGLTRGVENGRLPEGMVSAASLLGGARVLADESFAHSFLEEAQVMPGAQTRPNLKIQEGCGNRCSFCVIPQTRGGSRSLAAEQVLKQVRGFVAAGGKELVFSGINLGRWGRGPADGGGSKGLAELVRQIFAETELARLRLSSIEPMDWDTELIAVMAEFGNTAGTSGAGAHHAGGRLARHAHLPLQSGSDAVLRRMYRRYRPWHYAEKVEALVRAAGPELTLGADVMVGFPGETDAEFEETVELVRALPFGYLHVFPFSPRPGTRAWTLHAAEPVVLEAVKERVAELRKLAAEKTRVHRERMIGHELDAITLHTPEALAAMGLSVALTENFLPVEVGGRVEANELARVRVMGLNADGALVGEMMTQRDKKARISSDICAAVAV
ncbi:MAG TPA: MiaB/RimO family radical SAM methylthiotransferase [Terracidiphilus sp.]|nr:MiaB/RimO family radical SAM methylthiotransferase [Terracidiphilus sp.]